HIFMVQNYGYEANFYGLNLRTLRVHVKIWHLGAGNMLQLLHFKPKKNHSKYNLTTGNSKHPHAAKNAGPLQLIGTDIKEMDKNKEKSNKTKHEIGKSARNRV
ncbi:hypothetical protein Tco_0068118, partial [Tanacetum coccineum]